MSTWESEMTPKEWESIMGVPYSHISLEEGEANRKFNMERGMKKPWNMEKVQQVLDKVQPNWEAISREWCSCNYHIDSYSFHVPPNKHCPLCKAIIDNDHYHCGACSKVTQVG